MEIADIIRALHGFAASDSVASAARALGLDLSRASTTRTSKGYLATVDARDAKSRSVAMAFDPDDRSWILAWPGEDGPTIDPALQWGARQTITRSPTGRGYVIACACPLPTMMAASLPDNRLQSITVTMGVDAT